MDDFEVVFASVYPRAREVARRVLGSLTEAEDAAAEALARALADWPKIGRLPYREAWILRVTANVAIDAARRRPVTPFVTDEAAECTDDLPVLRLTLVVALSDLPRRQREALVLRHMAGFSEHDVAEAMGVSHNTVKKHLQRGMARLRGAFTPEGGSVAFE